MDEHNSDPLADALRAAFGNMQESERYEHLAQLFNNFSEQAAQAETGPLARVDELTAMLHRELEVKAGLEDALKSREADLTHRQAQLEAEQNRSKDLQGILDSQNSRLQELQLRTADLEKHIAAKEERYYELQRTNEQLEVDLQRARQTASDRTALESVSAGRNELALQLRTAQEEAEGVRVKKDAEIARLQAQLSDAGPSSVDGALDMAPMWDMLARTKPSLAAGHVPATDKSVERLMEAFITMVNFLYELEQAMRPWLGRFTKHEHAIRGPWDLFAAQDNVRETVKHIIDPRTLRPSGPLQMHLVLLKRFVVSAMIGCDSAIESIASELGHHIRGDTNPAGWNVHSQLREFAKEDGPEKFLDHMRRVRSRKMAAAYGKGV